MSGLSTELPQRVQQQFSRACQPRHYSADRDVRNRGDLFIGQLFHFPQNDDLAEFRRQLTQCLVNQPPRILLMQQLLDAAARAGLVVRELDTINADAVIVERHV